MRLETPRLVLRDFEPEDWQAVQEYAGDPEAVRYRPFGPCSGEETKAVIHAVSQQKHLASRTLYDLAIVRVADKRLIGGCDVGLRTDCPQEASIGYGLNRAYWNQGYMTEAMRAILAFAFATLKVERVSADVEPDNEASARVLTKIGMRSTGQARQWIKGTQRIVNHYAISREEWTARHEKPC